MKRFNSSFTGHFADMLTELHPVALLGALRQRLKSLSKRDAVRRSS